MEESEVPHWANEGVGEDNISKKLILNAKYFAHYYRNSLFSLCSRAEKNVLERIGGLSWSRI